MTDMIVVYVTVAAVVIILIPLWYVWRKGRRFTAGEVSKEAAQLEIEHFWAGALRRAVIDGDVEKGSLMAGQSIGMVTREEPAAAILEELMAQAAGAIAARGG